jgi:hypothetical protein
MTTNRSRTRWRARTRRAGVAVIACALVAACGILVVAPAGLPIWRSLAARAGLRVWRSLAAWNTRAEAGAGPGLRLVRTVLTAHGNAAHLVWSDDGKSLFLANEEGRMSAVRIDVSANARPRIAATQSAENFLWAVAQRGGLLVFQPSLGDETLRLDPRTLAVVWKRHTGPSHAIATDGSRVYVAQEGRPGTLLVLDASGRMVDRVAEPDGWASVYGMAYDAGDGLLCVAASGDEAKGIPGGVYLYDVRNGRPVKRGRIPQPASDIAVHDGRLWVASGNTLQTWRISDPAHPQLVGSWSQPVEAGPGGTPVRIALGGLAIDHAGTHLYAAYHYAAAQGGNDVPDWAAGVMRFDVSRDVPVPVTQQDWKFSGPYRVAPTALAIAPDGATLAVSYWRYGVRVYRVSGDRVVAAGGVATAGEAHDVYVDPQGILYIFANETMQIIDPRTGEVVNDFPLVNQGDGGWKPFADGTVVLRGEPAPVAVLGGGAVRWLEPLPNLGTYIWDNAYVAPYLYSGGENGTLFVQRIDVDGSGAIHARVVGSVQVPRADGTTGYAPLLAIAAVGSHVWVTGPTVGVAAIDVSEPASPRIVMHDRFTFQANGNHAGLVAARGRVYAGAGSAGVIVYDASTFKRTGSIGGLTVDFLDTIGSEFLVVANYWQPKLPEGAYVYDLRTNPDAPAFVDRFPRPDGNANFRVRVVGHMIYRVALYGIDILQGP